MRIFITGATGVVGRRVVPLVLAVGHEVTTLVRDEKQQRMPQKKGVTAALASLTDVAQLRRVVHGHDALINLATHMPSSTFKMLFRRSWRENDRIRREGSAAIADAVLATGVSCFIQESFAPIYEDGADRWLDETSPVRPVAYNATVLDAEQSAMRVASAGRTGIALRFGALYGPDSRVMHEMLSALRKGWSPMPGAPMAFLSSLAHDDAASAVVAALSASSGVYNVCDDEPLRRGEWLAVIASAIGVAPPRPLPRWLVGLGGSTMELLTRSQRISNAKLRKATGWSPKYPSFREGVLDAVRAATA